MGEAIDQIIEMISEFSDKFLDEEYKALIIKLAERLESRDDFSLNRGKPENWACAIIFAIGQMNFLFEPSFEPFVYNETLCAYFGASKQNMWNKARDIRRLLNLKLGDEEFTIDLISTLDIPESDEDLKRIRTFKEVKSQITNRPDTPEDVDNTELIELINEISKNDNEECWDKLFLKLRSTYFIKLFSGFQSLSLSVGDKFIIPLFTNTDKYTHILDEFDELTPHIQPFCNVLDYINNPDFAGVVINQGSDNFELTKEMILKVYPNFNSIECWKFYF